MNKSKQKRILPAALSNLHGWNEIKGSPDPLLKDVDMKKGFYFLHSYFFNALIKKDVVATVDYGSELPCIVRKNNIIGAIIILKAMRMVLSL